MTEIVKGELKPGDRVIVSERNVANQTRPSQQPALRF
jgi:hypothetical protein